MGIIQVKTHLARFGYEGRIQLLEKSSATVEEAADALQCQPAHIAKSLAFYNEAQIILIVAAGDTKIDNTKFKKLFDVKAKMVRFEEVEDRVGHVVGGVCPFGVKEDVQIYLDASLKRFEYVYPACGTPNSAIRLSIEELERLTDFKDWVDVCKNWD